RHTRSKRDWSSDVCSSDLSGWVVWGSRKKAASWIRKKAVYVLGRPITSDKEAQPIRPKPLNKPISPTMEAAAKALIPVISWAIEIGRASCRERVSVGVVAG